MLNKRFIEFPIKEKAKTRKLVHGSGINDADYLVRYKENGKQRTCPFFSVWHGMISRCYSKNIHIKQPTYIGCAVIKEWHYFSVFKKWMIDQDWKGKHLDKDILVVDNKIYSPKTCVFVPQYVNGLLTQVRGKNGKYPRGVSFIKETGKFLAQCNIRGKGKNLGQYHTIKEASDAYNSAKSDEIKRVAFLQANDRVRNGLLKHASVLLD